MVDTTIYIGNFAIHEPVTAFTDYIITILGFYFYYQLNKKSKGPVTRNWSLFFGLLGLSTFLGGSSHAFFATHEGISYKTVWLAMQTVNGFAVYFAQRATFNSILINSKHAYIWKMSYIIQLMVFVILLLSIQKYIVTIIENAVGLIPVLLLHLFSKPKEGYYKKIAYGILISFITAIVHGAKLSLHAYFNYNDIAHLLIIISLYIMYLGVNEKALQANPVIR